MVSIKDKLMQAATAKQVEDPVQVEVAEVAEVAEVVVPEVPQAKFQSYNCSRPSMRMITTKGTPIVFVSGQFNTINVEVIKYLDAEIASGLSILTKGGMVEAEAADPMSALKAKIIEEHEAKKAAEAAELETKKQLDTLGGSTGILSSSDVAASTDISSSSIEVAQ